MNAPTTDEDQHCAKCGRPIAVTPIKMPIPGPGMPRELGFDIVAWLIPAGVIVATVIAILCGAMWR